MTDGARQFDAVVLGAGPAGEVVVTQLSDRGLSAALVERELVGGECAYWACIPSKTLLRAPEVRAEASRVAGVARPGSSWTELVEYRDFMVRGLDDSGEVEEYEGKGVSVIKGEARLCGPGTVQVNGQTLRSDRIVVATGSEPRIPPIPGLQETGFWTHREATTLREVPDSVVVLGGGPVGIELGQLLRRLGSTVTVVEVGNRLLAREEPRVSELLLEAMRDDGITVHCDVQVRRVAAENGGRVVELDDDRRLRAAQVVVAGGRTPRIDGLGLERVGLEATEQGIPVDERCRAGEGIWAVGDVTGVMPFTHVAMYQGRIAAADIAGEPARAEYSAIPRVVFSDPEVAAVGMTGEQACRAGIDVAAAHISLDSAIARPWTFETEPRGELTLIADRRHKVLVGAWAVAPLASEWIHYAALAIKAQVPLAVLRDTVGQFPTYTEAYTKALARLDA